jgi:ribokinase
MKQIVVVGSINLDLVCSVERIPTPGETLTGLKFQTFHGGKGANQAVAAGRLGYPVSMIGKVGDDQFGPELKRGLRDAGVNVRTVAVAKKTSSGVASILTDKAGQNSIAVVPGANGAVLPKDVRANAALLRNAGMILCQLEVPLQTVSCVAEIAAKYKVPFMLDPAPARELPSELLSNVTYLTPNETEAGTLCGRSHGDLTAENVGEYAAELLGRGPANVIVKMGKLGAYFLSRGGERFFQPAFAVTAVDSTAAGDAFNAGLAVALMRGEALQDAARYAAAVAAISVSRPGAQPSMPTGREIARFLKSPKIPRAGKMAAGALTD